MDEITVTELHQLMQSDQPPVLLDVREQHEYDFAHIEGATLLPLSTLMERHSELESYRDHLIVAHCHHGMRSAQAIGFLQTQGYTNMKNLAGGIDAWSVEVDENVPIY